MDSRKRGMPNRRNYRGSRLLTNSLKPVVVEPYFPIDNADSFSEKSISNKTEEYLQSREVSPRFAGLRTLESNYGCRFKDLFNLYKNKEEALQREWKLEEKKLLSEIECYKFHEEAGTLRERLQQEDGGKRNLHSEIPANEIKKSQHQDAKVVRKTAKTNKKENESQPQRRKTESNRPSKRVDRQLYQPPQSKAAEQYTARRLQALEDRVNFFLAREMIEEVVSEGANVEALSADQRKSYDKFMDVRNLFSRS